ncbi:MAG: hypothetical protein U0M15_09995, partial [Bacillota bacterium]|nr:hypothetical protein [Bacillota bacterium]
CKNTCLFYFSNGGCGRGVVDDYAPSCVYGYFRGRRRKNIRNEDRAYAVIMDGEPLLPHSIDLLCLVLSVDSLPDNIHAFAEPVII